MATKLFVGGIAWATTDDSLKNHFSQWGTVVSATIITDKYTGRSKGFGFVEMSSDEEAQKAVTEGNNSTLDERQITVSEARPMVPREDRGGFGGGGGRRDDRRGGGRDFRGDSN